MNRKPELAILPCALIALVACAAAAVFLQPVYIGLITGGAVLVAAIIGTVSIHGYKLRINEALNDVFAVNRTVAGQVFDIVAIPSLIFDEHGSIIWANGAFTDMYDGSDISRLMSTIDPASPVPVTHFDLNGRSFQVMTLVLERESEMVKKLRFQYWIDRTETLHYSRLYDEQRPTVALIYVDNYEELTADKQFHRNVVLAEVEKRISEFVSSIEGVYRRYDNSKFIVIFEAKNIAEMEKARFPLLDAVREINTGTEQPVTLSISVGVENRVCQSDESARQGMELALGRGGDQAVVKRGTQYSFFGGKRQVSAKQTRVKARLFAKALRQLLENSDHTIIMGHKHPDMDVLGASLGLMRCSAMAGCQAYIVLEETNPSIERALEAMNGMASYRNCVINSQAALAMMRPGTVLIVVDTQREGSVISKELYSAAAKTVIIDHHRRPVDALDTPTLHYLEASSSSACEMVTEVIQYIDDNPRPTAFECGALLAGITLDTKHFAFNTGARTFEAASYLRKNGADTSLVKLMFQDDLQTYRDRSQVVETAILLDHGIAISCCADDVENNTLIAAQAADELISIKGIRASFVLARRGEVVYISGRSLGDINVQVILERMGGGGHLTVAGAQLTGVSIDDAIGVLTEHIQEYIKEVQD